MTARAPITLHQGNTETLHLSITPDSAGDSLAGVTSLETVIKDGVCVADTDPGVVHLSTADPTQMVITTHTAALIVAEVYLPVAVTTPPYDRWWRVDALVGAARRTAAYGPVTIIDL